MASPVRHGPAGKVPRNLPAILEEAAAHGSLAECSDAELVLRARDRGDGAALEELVRRHRDAAYRVALRICLDPVDAEDVAQEAFVRAWRALPRFKGESAFSTWLYRIVTNLALNAVTRRRPAQPLDDERGAVRHDAPHAELDPARRVQDRERLAAVAAALAALTPEQRACWVLREVEGLPYEELAEVMGLTLAAVKGRLFRARGELAAALASYDREES
jgi:RNA polymerase sigma-70 factor (ECF subfamily)